MERHGSRSPHSRYHSQTTGFAAETSEASLEASPKWIRPRVRVAVAVVIVAGLVLGTAGLSYGQAAPSSGSAKRGILASESVEGPTKPDTGPGSVLDPDADIVASELLDELGQALESIKPEPVEPGPVEPVDTPQAELDTDPLSKITEAAPVEARSGVVHLTFDDGPDPRYTPAILDILARYDAKVTFFVLGSLAEAHPELIERMVAEGHTVANHSWNHEDLTKLTHAEFNRSVGRTQEALGPHATSCLRPPYGALNSNTRAWAAELGLDLVLWTTDTRDWQKPGADIIAELIVEGAESSSPILLHDAGGDRTQTIEALDRALSELSGQGFSFEPTC